MNSALPASLPAALRAHQRLLVLLALLSVFVLCAHLFWSFTCDDSYITFRYAQNAARGLGLVFNPGERVEGYSNPLWTFLLVASIRLGFDVVVAAKTMGLLAGLGALLFAYGIAGRLSEKQERWQPLVILALLGPGLAYYSVCGMETSLYCCLLTGAVYCLLLPGARAQWGMAALALAAALTRPEGILVLGGLLGWRMVCWRQSEGKERSAILGSSALAILGLALFLLWRHSYFGSWLPNTYYAKPPGTFGGNSVLYSLSYLREFLENGATWLWMPLSMLWLRQRRVAAGAMLLVLAVEVALAIHARGDWMSMSRFLVPTLPLLAAFGFAGLLKMSPTGVSGVPKRYLVIGVLGVLVSLNSVHMAEKLLNFRENQYPESVMAGQAQRAAGEWLRANYPPQTVLACKRIGGISEFSGMSMVDMLGLTDRKIAMIRHTSSGRGEAEQAAMAEEIFSRKPDLILLCVMKRWDNVPPKRPAPDLADNLRDVDNKVYEGLERHGYHFVQRLPQGGTGEFAVYQSNGTRTSNPQLRGSR